MDFQIYFFSTIVILKCGIFLAYDKFGEYFKFDKLINATLINHKGISITFGFLSMISGIVMMIRPINGIPVFGDLIPAIFAIIGGVSLLLTHTNMGYRGQNKFLIRMQEFIKTNMAVIGLLMLVFGMLHALLPDLALL